MKIRFTTGAASALALCVALALPAAAQKPAAPAKSKPELCQAASSQIEHFLKEAAYERFSGIGDNSAPRETNRQQRVTASLQAISLQLQHMQSLGCQPYMRTISPSAYATAALECHATGGRAIDDKCKFELWARDADTAK